MASARGWLCLSLMSLAGACAAEPFDEVETIDRPIVNGTLTTDFPGTGMLMGGPSAAEAGMFCSATLIGCDTVLTAAHCVCASDSFGADCDKSDPAQTFVFFQNAGAFQVASIDVDPSYNNAYEHDAAVLRLVAPVTGIRPVPVASSAVAAGSPAVIVGYGRTGGEVYEYGLKRQGAVTTTACSEDTGVQKLCWLFDGSAGSSESNVCHGDSGGSTYVLRGAVPEVVGVHSTTNQLSCLEGGGTFNSADTGVFEHRTFITDVAAGSLAEEFCGDLPQIGETGATVISETGAVELAGSADLTVEVPRGTAQLRIALNSTDGAGANLDMYVKALEPASPSFADCSAAGAGAHGFCQFDSPEPGTWHVQVVAPGMSASRGGEFQMTATILGGAPLGADDTYAADASGLSVDAAGGVLANDEGTDRGALTATIDEPPAHGQVELAADGSFQYLPEAGYLGEDSFTYLASDGTYQGQAVVTLTVGTGGGDDDHDMTGGCAAGGGTSGLGAFFLIALVALIRRRR
jgi:uncharacterized protein (TIGR03382 family)